MASSLDLLEFQPIRFGYDAEMCANNDNREYCNLVQDGDTVEFQLRRILGNDLGCELTDVSTDEDVLNPLFVNNTAWTFSGGFAWNAASGGIARITASTGSVQQNLITPVDKAMYKVTVTTITQLVTSGANVDMNVDLSGVTIGTIVKDSLAGAYTFYGVLDSGTPTIAIASSGGNITVDVTSIEVFRAAPCYTFDVTAGTIGYDDVNGLSIDGTVDVSITLPFEVSSKYSPKTSMFVSNYQTGTVTFGFDGDISPTLNGVNGTTTWISNGDTYGSTVEISFFQYIGNVNSISFEQLSSDYYFALYDIDGSFVQTLNAYIEYCRDYIIVRFDPQAEGFSYGCYQIGLYDPYLHLDDHIEFEYDFTTLGAPWTVQSGGVWALTGGVGYEYDSANANGAIDTDEVAGNFVVAWGKVKFETGTLSGAGVGSLSMGIEIQDGTLSGITTYSVTAASDTIYTNVSEGDVLITYINFGFIHPKLFVTGTVAADHLEFKNAFYKIYPYHRDYLSNCFTYQESIPCSKLIVGYPGVNMGFNSTNCNFAINQRFRNVRITPSYKVNASDFIGSDGVRVLVSGTMQKSYTLLFDYMGELAHDVVAALLMCKIVYICEDGGSDISTAKRYFLIPQDYQPEWDKDGKLNLAMGRIQMIEYNQVKFTTNCQ